MPLIVLMTVFFTGSFFAGAADFLTTVAALASLLSLVLLGRPFPIAGFGPCVATVLLPLPAAAAVVTAGFVPVTFLVAAAPLLAFSTICATISAPRLTGTAGAIIFTGETGRANKDFGGCIGRTGESGYVRELAERGESTCDGGTLDVVRAGGI